MRPKCSSDVGDEIGVRMLFHSWLAPSINISLTRYVSLTVRPVICVEGATLLGYDHYRTLDLSSLLNTILRLSSGGTVSQATYYRLGYDT